MSFIDVSERTGTLCFMDKNMNVYSAEWLGDDTWEFRVINREGKVRWREEIKTWGRATPKSLYNHYLKL